MEESNEYLGLLYKQLSLSQLFMVQSIIEKTIKDKVAELKLNEMDVAGIKHKAINSKTVCDEGIKITGHSLNNK